MTELAGDDRIVCNAPMVVSETIDGEAIIMHHGTGHYFDTSGSGALLWQAIEAGASVDTLASRLTGAYRIEPGAAQATVRAFVDGLFAHDLVRREAGTATAFLAPVGDREAFAAPLLGVHADLADMLLLDPIHDVDETGWPAARPAGG